MSNISMARKSPGDAPYMAIGPVTGFIHGTSMTCKHSA